VKPIERKMLVVAVVVGVLLGLGSSCRQETTPEAKQARLIAAESIQLRRQLADCEGQMERLRARHAEEIERREAQLAAGQTRIEALERDLQDGIARQVGSVMAAVMDENARLRREIETLRAEIEAITGRQPSQP
jgi:chromosome segregation ATPase